MCIYTKSVVTVIAVCLVWICVRDISLVQSAEAQQQVTPQMLRGMIQCDRIESDLCAFRTVTVRLRD